MGGDELATAVVQQPRPQRLLQPQPHGRAHRGERRQGPSPQVGQRLRVGAQQQLGQEVVGVEGSARVGLGEELASAQHPLERPMYLQPRSLGPDDRPAPFQLAHQPLPIPPGGVGHEQDAGVLVVDAGRLSRHRQGPGVEEPEHRAQLPLGQEHRGERPWRVPVGPPSGRDEVGLLAATDEQRGQSVAIALARAPGSGQFVGMTRDARGRQGVDVGEHQLGKRPQRGRRHPGRHCLPRQTAPADSRPDPVCRLQRVHGPATAGLAAAQLIGCSRAWGDGFGRVGAAADPGQLEEIDQGQLDGGTDARTHGVRKRPGIAGHFAHDGLDGLGSHPRDDASESLEDVLFEGQGRDRRHRAGGRSGSARGPWGDGHGFTALSLANKSSAPLHVEPSEI